MAVVKICSLHVIISSITLMEDKIYQHQKGHLKIDTWDDLKRVMESRFFPQHVEFNTRRNLRHLQHMRTIK